MQGSVPRDSSAMPVAAGWFDPQMFQTPGVPGLAAAGHVALIISSDPATIPAIFRLVALHPSAALVVAATIAGVTFAASRLSGDGALQVRRLTIGCIAACLTLVAADMLNLLRADLPPWAMLVGGLTAVVLVGGITTLIADVRRCIRR